MVELERTYLAKSLPENLSSLKQKEVADLYLPATVEHPVLRIRKNGEKFEITKKQPVDGDRSTHTEDTIPLTPDEYDVLMTVPGKAVRKIRYFLPYEGLTLEVDVFQDDLAGLVLVDVEFPTQEAKEAFVMPSFCLAEVTHEVFMAGGTLCGKTYADISGKLEKYAYQPLHA